MNKLNKKMIMGITIGAVLLLAVAMIIKISHKPTAPGIEESSLVSAEQSSGLAGADSSQAASQSSEVSETPEPESAETSAVPDSGIDEAAEQAKMVKEAAGQILYSGGVWTQQGNSKVQLTFARDTFALSAPQVASAAESAAPVGEASSAPAATSPSAQKYSIESAAFVSATDDAHSVYAITLADGRKLSISAYNGNKYVLHGEELFPEMGKGAVFEKTAEIVFGSKPLTDEERDKQSMAAEG